MKKTVLAIITATIVLMCILSACNTANNPDADELERLGYSLIYELNSGSGRHGYTITIDKYGMLTKKYIKYNVEWDNNEIINRQLSQVELSELAKVITDNKFFSLPYDVSKNILPPPGNTSMSIDITVEDKEYHSHMNNSHDNSKLQTICDYIDYLANGN